jgi:hypothetical protein
MGITLQKYAHVIGDGMHAAHRSEVLVPVSVPDFVSIAAFWCSLMHGAKL